MFFCYADVLWELVMVSVNAVKSSFVVGAVSYYTH